MDNGIVAAYAMQTGSEPPMWYAMPFDTFGEGLFWIIDNSPLSDDESRPLYALASDEDKFEEACAAMTAAFGGGVQWFCVAACGHQDRY